MPHMTAASNAREVVRDFVRAINERNLPALSTLMSHDHVFVDATGGVVIGRDATMSCWADFFRLFPDYAIAVETVVQADEFVAVFGSVSATYNGNRGLVPMNRIGMPSSWLAVVREGVVQRWQVYADWTGAVKVMTDDANTT